jgi:hypothetical protein
MIDLLSFLIAAPSSRRCADDGAFYRVAQAGRGAVKVTVAASKKEATPRRSRMPSSWCAGVLPVE